MIEQQDELNTKVWTYKPNVLQEILQEKPTIKNMINENNADKSEEVLQTTNNEETTADKITNKEPEITKNKENIPTSSTLITCNTSGAYRF